MKIKASAMGSIAAVVFLLLLPISIAYAQIPQPKEVPLSVPESERSLLKEERVVLFKARKALKAAISGHNRKCQNVRTDSALMSECSAVQKRLQSQIQDYVTKVVIFNNRVVRASASAPLHGGDERKE